MSVHVKSEKSNIPKKNGMFKKVVISSVFAGALLTTPAMADAALGDQTLRQGMVHSDVKELQNLLQSKGLYRSTIDGIYGPLTADAVRQFQRQAKIQVDGIAGPQTFKALKVSGDSSKSNAKAKSSSSSSKSSSIVLRPGSRGQAVSDLQTQLKKLNYYHSTVDGSYGPLTTQAVRSFQKDHRLQVDGIAGPQTFNALKSAGNHSKSNAKVKPQSNSSKSSSIVLRPGSRGQAVSDLQTQLKKLNYYHSTVDGKYGPLTTSAVRTFQINHNLQVDGIAGPQTLKALNNNPVKNSAGNSSGQSSSSGKTAAILEDAKRLIGSPYKWGGTSPSGFDCSGFIYYLYKNHGKSVPRTVAGMWRAGSPVSTPRVGDIVFFDTTGGASHAGFYLGNNQFIHAGTSSGVTISNMNNSYWKPRYLGARSF